MTDLYKQFQSFLEQNITQWTEIKKQQETAWTQQTTKQQQDFTTQLQAQQTEYQKLHDETAYTGLSYQPGLQHLQQYHK